MKLLLYYFYTNFILLSDALRSDTPWESLQHAVHPPVDAWLLREEHILQAILLAGFSRGDPDACDFGAVGISSLLTHKLEPSPKEIQPVAQ